MTSKKRNRPARGGKGGFEPRSVIVTRENNVLELHAQGIRQHEIARRLDISQPAVSRIIKRACERIRHDSDDWARRMRFQVEQHLTLAVREAVSAFQKSKEPRTRKRQRRSNGDGHQSDVTEVIVDESPGDPRFLESLVHAARALADLVGQPQDAGSTEDTDTIEFGLEFPSAPQAPAVPDPSAPSEDSADSQTSEPGETDDDPETD